MNKYSVDLRRRKLKMMAVEYKGGKCVHCGYNKSYFALEFHHLDPSQKSYNIANPQTRSWEKVKKELDKCELVCSNCHKEIEAIPYEFKYILLKAKYKNGMLQKEKNKCHCGQIIHKLAKMCNKHYRESVKRKRPSKEELEKLLYMYPMTGIAKQFNVSGNTIKDWSKDYGIDIPKFRTGYWTKVYYQNRSKQNPPV